MRILFLEDDGLTGLAGSLRAGGDEPVVLRTGAYDDWHPREDPGEGTEVVQLPRDADAGALAAAALALRPDAVVSLALLDPHVQRDAAVAHALRPIPAVANSPEATAAANDKYATKTLLAAHGLPVVEAIKVEDGAQALAAAARLGYPVVLKRNDGYSGMGMRLFEDAAQMEAYYRRSPGTMLVEAFAPGLELSVDVLGWEGRHRAMTVVSKGQTDRNLRRHPIYRLRLAPHPLPPALDARVREVAESAVRLLGLTGVAECEMILGGDGVPRVLEINPRIAGTLRLSAAASGIDPHRCLADMARGRFDVRALRPAPAAAVQVPLRDAPDEAAAAALLAQPEVLGIKRIDWMPGLGVRASVTVRAADAPRLLDWLRRQPAHPEFAEAAQCLQPLFDTSPAICETAP